MRGPARSPPRAPGNAPASNPREYWGSLITDQHPPQASPLFRRLLHAIVVYVNEHLDPTDIRELTPQKLSSFYRSVGGEGLDELFLHTSFQRLSQIYTALGCAHSLQPLANEDFKPPAIPALTTRGFIIWQTVQLLMDPTEHRPYIQNAVRKFPLRDPETQQLFPRDLIPDSCFPRVANKETVSWHEDVSRKLFAEPDVGESAAGDVSEAEPVRVPPPHKQDRYGRRSRPASRKPSRQHTPVESDYDTAEDWGYGAATPHRNTRTHHPRPEVYAVPTAAAGGAYSRSAPGGGEEYAHHRAYPDIKVATPVASDVEEEYEYRPSRNSRKHKTSSRRPSASRSRQRGAAGYAVYSNGEQVPISYPPMAAAAAAKGAGVGPGVGVGADGYLRPATRLHAYQSFPDLAGGYVGGQEGYAAAAAKEERRRRRSTSSGRRRKEYYEDDAWDSDDGLAGGEYGGQWVGRRSAGAGRHGGGGGGGGGGGRRVPKAYY